MIDIRRFTGLIIQKNGEYLVGRIMRTRKLRWSRSPYDAWFTKNREDAEAIAELVGGEIMLFNPIAGQEREARL